MSLPNAILRARDTFDISVLSLLVPSSLQVFKKKHLLNEGPEIIFLCLKLVQINFFPRRLDHEFASVMFKTDLFVSVCALLS